MRLRELLKSISLTKNFPEDHKFKAIEKDRSITYLLED